MRNTHNVYYGLLPRNTHNVYFGLLLKLYHTVQPTETDLASKNLPSQTLKRRSMVLAGEVTLTLALGGACSPSSLSSRSRRLVNKDVPPT